MSIASPECSARPEIVVTDSRHSASTLSVIIPAYDEAKTVSEILDRVIQQPVVSQIVFVDDGSTDDTWRIVQQFVDSLSPVDRDRCVLLQHEQNQGKGRAIRTGLEHVSGTHVLIQDADLEYDPADIPKLWDVMQAGQADVVFGSRYLNNPGLQKGRFVLQSGVRFLNLLTRLLYRVRLTDQATCYKMFRTADLKSFDLRCEGFEFCAEVTAKAAQSNLTIKESAVKYNHRSSEAGKKLRWNDGAIIIKHLAFRRLQDYPLQVLAAASILILSAAIGSLFLRDSGTRLAVALRRDEWPRDLIFDSGRVPIGTVITHTFEIANEWSTPVAPNEFVVKRSCGCSSARIRNQQRIMPGDVATVDMTVNTDHKEGSFSESVVVTVSDQLKSDVSFRCVLKGTAFPGINTNPTDVEISLESQASSTATVYFSSELPLNWAQANVQCPWPELSWSWTEPSNQGAAIRLNYDANSRTNSVARNGIMLVSVPEEGASTVYSQEIRVRVVPQSDLQIIPPAVTSCFTASDGTQVFQLMLKGPGVAELNRDLITIFCDKTAFKLLDFTAISERLCRVRAQTLAPVEENLNAEMQAGDFRLPVTFYASEAKQRNPLGDK